MFTGIVEQLGKVIKMTPEGENKHFVIQAEKPLHLAIGDSIAVNGVCLTIIHINNADFAVTAVAETLRLTNLNLLDENAVVNLETPLTPNRSMGGHYVQGHVDGMAKIMAIDKSDSWTVQFSIAPELAKYIIQKGFITIDGMSITVIDVSEKHFSVMFIPHTIEHTIVKFYQLNQFVNIEVDMMAKYVERYFNAV